MKFIILFVLSVVALAKGGPPPIFQYLNECKGSATDADLAAIISHADKLPEQAYCVLACAMKKTGMMTAANKVSIDTVKTTFANLQQKLPEVFQGFVAIFESCQPTGTPSECEAAKLIYECSEPKIKQLLPMPGGGPH